jgi:hypothetical protein
MKLIRSAVSTPIIIKAPGTTKEYNYLVINCKYRQHKNKNGAIIYFVTDGKVKRLNLSTFCLMLSMVKDK